MRLLLIGILSSLFISCGNEINEIKYFKTYTYTNNSGHSLHIEKHSNESNITYELPKLETINFSFELNSGNCLINDERQSSVSGGCLLIFADSLKIIFDDNKSILLKPEDMRDINILKEKNYDYSKIGRTENFKYSFTQIDYEQAN